MRAETLSGELIADRGDVVQVVVIVEGVPVDARSTGPRDPDVRLLVEKGGLDEASARDAVKSTPEHQDVADHLERTGTLTSQAASAVRRTRVSRAITEPLRWSRGAWTFRQLQTFAVDAIDPALLPGITLMGSVREALSFLVPLQDAMAHASSWSTPMRTGTRWNSLAIDLAPPQPIIDGIATGATPQHLLGKHSRDSAELCQWLWLLDHTGAIDGPGSQAIDAIVGSLADAGAGQSVRWSAPRPHRRSMSARAPAPASAPRARPNRPQQNLPPVEHVERMLLADEQRLGQTHYSMLGVHHDEPQERIDHALRRLQRRWEQAASDPRLNDHLKGIASRLADAAKVAHTDLSDSMKRAAYDLTLGIDRSLDALDIEYSPSDRSRGGRDHGEGEPR